MSAFKRYLVNKAIVYTDSWNQVIHDVFEKRIFKEYDRSFPQGIEDEEERAKIIERMRQFYYTRMMTTATTLLAVSSLIVSLVALIVAIVALK